MFSDADAKSFIMTAVTPRSDDGSNTNVVGLALNHVYTIVSVHTLKNADGTVKA
jgi:hypothetical protein